MKEKNKMQKGLIFNIAQSKTLFTERMKCKNLCHKYNSIYPEMLGYRNELMMKILGQTHGAFIVEQPFHCDYGYNIEVGENFYSNFNLTILDSAKVLFGNNVMIGPNCSFYTIKHPFNKDKRNQGFALAKPIKIGNNVWFGGNVTVLPGVTISDNSVIGAGSVVTKDIPSNVTAAGNPCKVLRDINRLTLNSN